MAKCVRKIIDLEILDTLYETLQIDKSLIEVKVDGPRVSRLLSAFEVATHLCINELLIDYSNARRYAVTFMSTSDLVPQVGGQSSHGLDSRFISQAPTIHFGQKLNLSPRVVRSFWPKGNNFHRHASTLYLINL